MKILVKRSYDGGAIPSHDGWTIMGAHAEYDNGKKWSEWATRPATSEEINGAVIACGKFFEAGCPKTLEVEV